MSRSSLKVLSCICSCFLVTVNNFSIIIGLLFLASGVVLTFGLSWLTSNAQILQLLSQLSDLLKDYIHRDIDISELVHSLGSITGSIGASFIVLGAVVVALSCLGCLGACCRLRPCLLLYSGLVGLIFLAQLTVVIIWYADSNVLKSASKTAMSASVSRYTGLRSGNVESLLQNVVQIYAGCCGVDGGQDFNTPGASWDRRYTVVTREGRNHTFNLAYPATCCQYDLILLRPLDPYCPYNNSRLSNHAKGCYTTLFYYIETYFLSFLFAALAGILGLQLLLISGGIAIFAAESKSKSRVAPRKV